ncbi:MAG: ABC transporter ATP-binding protein [Pygmaiobacter massiliensis]|nr:ABC transporter ATP-binding protein [Pygmaiobacter massiliensis]
MGELLRAEELAFSYREQPVFSEVSFSADEGEYISIIGENGSGKSTLMQLLNGYAKPQAGKVLYQGEDLIKIPASQRAKSIAAIGQNTVMNFPFTCFELVMLGMYPHRARFERTDEKSLSHIRAVMGETDTLSLADKQITQISGGEYQRVLLARALAQRPRLLLLDEAMSDLDVYAKIKMIKLLRKLTREGLTVIAVNHDLSVAYSFSDRILALHGGRLVANGSPYDVFTGEFLKTVFGVKGEITPQNGLCIYDTI